MQPKKSSKELINCFKDYIDIADASYALLHNVFWEWKKWIWRPKW